MLSVPHEAHPGIEKMKMVARSHVWWPGIDEAIENKVNGCTICQVHRRAPRSVQQTPWPFPENAWSRLHVDFGGPFQGIYFLVLVDAFSKWVEVHRVPSPSAKATVECLRSIFATHGLPDVVVSDNGPAFVSAEFKEFLARNGVRAITIPPYHPASNGAAERVVQTIKEKLKKAKPGCFEVKIPRILFNYRTTPHHLTGRTPAELLMGRRLKTPLDLLHPDLRVRVGFKQLQQKERADNSARRDELPQPGDRVWARNFRPGDRWVPAIAEHPTSASSARVMLEEGGTWNRHGDHLRQRAPVPPQDTLDVQQPLESAQDNMDVQPPLESVVNMPLGQQTFMRPEDSVARQTPLGSVVNLPSERVRDMGGSCVSRADIQTPSAVRERSGQDVQAEPVRNDTLRRSTRQRRPPIRYSP